MSTPSPGEWTEDMGEISGFGGDYEECCRAMLRAGLKWFDEHPEAKPEIPRLCEHLWDLAEDNDDAKALSAAVIKPGEAGGGATGAMHQAVVSAVLFIKAQGWPAYVAMMRERTP